MADAASILNPNNPLLDSEEEDDDFEPEVPVTNDGLFVTTRSGKGGTLDFADALDDGDPVLKRKIASIFEDMLREDEKENEMLRKKPKVENGFKDLMTTDSDGISYFKRFTEESSSPEESKNEMQTSIQEAVQYVKALNSKKETTHVVKFAGQKIEIKRTQESSQSLDTLVHSLESKKTISTIDKSSYDWDQFKEKEGIKEEVEKAKKNGYLDKQEFLSRVDLRQFEKERAQRERERIQRENERRQNKRCSVCFKQSIKIDLQAEYHNNNL